MLLFLEEVFITCFLVAGESSFSYYVILLLLEEIFITCFPIAGESSSSYLRGFFLPLFPIGRMFFVCSLIFFWSVWSCSSHTSTSLGSSFSFLLFCLDTNFRTWFSFFTTKFTNFFMTEEGGSYKQGIYLYRNAILLGGVCLGNPRICLT